MNEITRIHLAKIAYDIEPNAKKHLEHYIKELEGYTGGGGVLRDVEIRMTELLAERKVVAGGVIADDDVAAIRAQLGEPYEFAEEDGDIAVGPVEEHPPHARRFFRDIHGALLGGVLSGIALYFKVDALWVRLAFVVLLFVSAGVAFFGYLLLWVIIPPANTATDKLRQVGQPVTVNAIRSLKAAGESLQPSRVAPVVQRTITIILGIVSVAFAVGTLLFAVFTLFGTVGSDITDLPHRYGFNPWAVWTLLGVGVFGFALLTALFSLIAYSFFAQKLTKRMLISGVVIIVLGLVSGIVIASIVTIQSYQVRTTAERMVKHTRVALSKDFTRVTAVSIEDPITATAMSTIVPVQYIVSTGDPYYEFTALPGSAVHVTIDDTTAHISVKAQQGQYGTFVSAGLVIHGPELASLTADNMNVNYVSHSQVHELTITGKNGASIALGDGSVGTLAVRGSGTVDVSGASVGAITINGEHGLSVRAGTVRTLTLTLPDVCPSSGGQDTNVSVSGVTSGSIMYNGVKRNAVSYQTNCAQLLIGTDETNF